MMKKLLIIFTICVVSLFGIMLCYADLQSSTIKLTEDLPLYNKLETAEVLSKAKGSSETLQSILTEQSMNLNILHSIYYMGYYAGSFDGGSLLRSLEFDRNPMETVSLYNSAIYNSYYQLRTQKLLKQYEASEAFDYKAFISSGRAQFDGFYKTVLKNEASKEQLLLLLQCKLLDKLPELDAANSKVILEEILSIRLSANQAKAQDYVYQFFEGRVRTQLLEQLAEMNKQKLQHRLQDIGIRITSAQSGELLLKGYDEKGKDLNFQVLNTGEDVDGFNGLTTLWALLDNQVYQLKFMEKSGSTKEVEIKKAIEAIVLNEEGIIFLDLDKLFEQTDAGIEDEAQNQAAAAAVGVNRNKSLAQLYASKSKAAGEIIKELNRYSIYLELKNKKISNTYTRSFDNGLKTWKSNLEGKLKTFGAAGMADFISYIKKFELLDRGLDKSTEERNLIARYRNSDLQFRKTEEGSIWITDLLFKLRTMQ